MFKFLEPIGWRAETLQALKYELMNKNISSDLYIRATKAVKNGIKIILMYDAKNYLYDFRGVKNKK
jgi:hypothetical protein